MDFDDLLDDANWTKYEDYINSYDSFLEEDIKKSVLRRNEYRDYLIKEKRIGEHIMQVEDEKLYDAHDKLFSGNVAATDGTLNKYPLLTGLRCRIGIISTSYKNDKIDRVFYISEREFSEQNSSNPKEFFENLGRSTTISNLFLTSLMSYKERQMALERPQEWKFIHGTLVPLELRVPRIGDAFESCLELAKKIINYKKCVGVISGSSEFDLVGSGIVLNHGEYLHVDYVSKRLEEDINESIGNKAEEEILYNFRDDFLSKIKIGVFRVGPKPYLFEAHEDVFDEAAALIIRDSMNQPYRGFPLLIDYADSLCHQVIGPGEFNDMIERKMARLGGYSGFGYEIPERKLRRR